MEVTREMVEELAAQIDTEKAAELTDQFMELLIFEKNRAPRQHFLKKVIEILDGKEYASLDEASRGADFSEEE